MDENALIRDAKKGDLDAFNRLVLAYQDMVYSHAFRMLGEVTAAEDATQDTFIAAFENIRSYRRGSFAAWLMRIVTNTCHDLIRYQGRRPTLPLEPLDDQGEEIDEPYWIPDESEGLEEAAMRAELGEVIRGCLQRVPERYRAVLVMADIQGLSYEEVAEVVETPVGTVKSRLARGRKYMEYCLKTFWELFSDV
jgi:RNA polymerase sigma-70 factor (ECF subfamily)